jgi:cytochrome b561
MPFREKSAWISLVLILVVFGPYFWFVGRALSGQDHVHFGTQFALIGLFILLEVVLHVAIAVQSPRDARAPRDERENLIDLKATRFAFYVLFAGVMTSILSLHYPISVWVLSQLVLFSVVAAEVVKFGSQIVFFRRGI